MITRVRTISKAAALCSAFLGTSGLIAQPPSGGGANPVEGSRIAPATRAAIEKSLASYKALTSYRDKQLARFEAKFKPGTEPDMPKMLDQETTLAWGAPNRIAMSSPFVSVHSDGTLVTCSIPTMGQYVQEPTPASFDAAGPMDLGSATPGMWLAQHDVASLLMRRPEDAGRLLQGVESWGESRAETLNGEAGVRVSGTLKGSMITGSDEPVAFTVFIADATGLIREVRRDMTAMYRESLEGFAGEGDDAKKPEIEKAEWVFAFNDVKINEPIADSEFEFKPGEGARKVEKFDLGGGPGGAEADPQMALIGKPAPAIKAKMLDGSAFELASLKGKVVLLDFWATWCGPCVQAMPKVQKVAAKFADKGVVVLGVNSDGGDTQKVSGFLEKRKITIRQVMDADGGIGRDYGVTGIPCMVMIDAEGVVQDIHVGAGPSIERELTAQVEKMLRGESLHTPEEIAKFQKGAEGAAGGDGEAAGGAAAGAAGEPAEGLRPLNTEKLVAGNRLVSQGGWGTFTRDLDGDGLQELLVPDAQCGLAIISSDGATSRAVRFTGAGSFSVTSAAQATLDGRKGWVVGGTRLSVGPEQGAVVGFFGEDGAKVWQYTPDFGPGTGAQTWIEAADLDGDGSTEVVVLATTFEMKNVRPNEYESTRPRSVLTVLDSTGAVVSRRSAGEFVSGMWVASPKSAGGPRMIVVTGAAGAETYAFMPKATGDGPK